MKYAMMSIYDTVAEVFNKPFASINNADAIRAFTQSLDDNPNKNDYALYRIGEFDDNEGVFIPEKNPSKIYTGFDIKQELAVKQSDDLPMLKDQAS
jgi:hypothetical protein